MKIAIFFHCLFYWKEPPELAPAAVEVVNEQMFALQEGGLLYSADHFEVGINGGDESKLYASLLIPDKAKVVFHGLDSYNENSTIRQMENWLPGHPGWAVLYFHAKGATWPYDHPIRKRWRGCMMRHCVRNWRQCIVDLQHGFDAVGAHWMEPPDTPPGHHIFAGSFWWAKSDFLLTLPSIMQRDRIKSSGLKHPDSRYEAEVWLGNGPRVPRVKDYHPHWNPGMTGTCKI